MKILVTGGAGYVGSVLVSMLLENGYRVRVLDSLMYGGGGLLSHFRNPRFDFVHGDIRDAQAVKQAVNGVDAIVHLAAIVGFPACRLHPEMATSTNFEGTKVVAQAIGRSVPIVYASTGSNYGSVPDGICTEETPLNPLSLYGKTKTAAELYLLENCQAVAYRFATAFGLSPRMRLDLLVNDFVHTAMKQRYLVVYESHYMRTFIHVADMARSFMFALQNSQRMIGEVYNVGSESMNCSKAQICEMIREKIDYYLHFGDTGTDADQRNYVVSYKKINSLGWDTTVTLVEGIDELVKGVRVLDVRTPYSNVRDIAA